MVSKSLEHRLVLEPEDIDISECLISKQLGRQTYVMGVFNPGLTIRDDGTLVLMARVAIALEQQKTDKVWRSIRLVDGSYTIDEYPIRPELQPPNEPRIFYVRQNNTLAIGLTSISFLLPVEIDPADLSIKNIHYDKAIYPSTNYQSLGLEDARITRYGDKYLMTAVCVSPHGVYTSLYESYDGISYHHIGIIDRGKDVVLFGPHRLNRPEPPIAFVDNPLSHYKGGKCVDLVTPNSGRDILTPGLFRMEKGTLVSDGIGPAAPPMEDKYGWFTTIHGVHKTGADDEVGNYVTLQAWLDKKNPSKVLSFDTHNPILEFDPALVDAEKLYIPSEVIFTCGHVKGIGDLTGLYIFASGCADQFCQIDYQLQDSFHPD